MSIDEIITAYMEAKEAETAAKKTGGRNEGTYHRTRGRRRCF